MRPSLVPNQGTCVRIVYFACGTVFSLRLVYNARTVRSLQDTVQSSDLKSLPNVSCEIQVGGM
jgi:hypothetical protein